MTDVTSDNKVIQEQFPLTTAALEFTEYYAFVSKG